MNRLLPGGAVPPDHLPAGHRSGVRQLGRLRGRGASRLAGRLRGRSGIEAAAGNRQIFVVWAGGYQGYGLRCERVVETLQANPITGSASW